MGVIGSLRCLRRVLCITRPLTVSVQVGGKVERGGLG